jgi:hypothetical protein
VAIIERKSLYRETLLTIHYPEFLVLYNGPNSTEVRNMLLTEWNWDDAKEVWQEEAWEKGRQEGQKNILDLMRQGYTAEQIEAMMASRPASGLHL